MGILRDDGGYGERWGLSLLDDGGCGERWGSCFSFPYSCGWVLYILFYLHVLYSLLTPWKYPGVRVTRHLGHSISIVLCPWLLCNWGIILEAMHDCDMHFLLFVHTCALYCQSYAILCKLCNPVQAMQSCASYAILCKLCSPMPWLCSHSLGYQCSG